MPGSIADGFRGARRCATLEVPAGREATGHPSGQIAQLVRAPRLHRGGRGFEPLFAHFSATPRFQTRTIPAGTRGPISSRVVGARRLRLRRMPWRDASLACPPYSLRRDARDGPLSTGHRPASRCDEELQGKFLNYTGLTEEEGCSPSSSNASMIREIASELFSLGFVSISKMLHHVGEENPPKEPGRSTGSVRCRLAPSRQ